jgi:hypothetical protein
MRGVKRTVRYVGIGVAWLVVTLLGSIAVAMVYEPLRSFGPTLFLIDGALLLSVLTLWKLWRSVPRIAVLATSLFLAARLLSPQSRSLLRANMPSEVAEVLATNTRKTSSMSYQVAYDTTLSAVIGIASDNNKKKMVSGFYRSTARTAL